MKYQSESVNSNSLSFEILNQYHREILKNKWETKFFRKVQMEILEIYIDKIKHLFKKYTKTIFKFI